MSSNLGRYLNIRVYDARQVILDCSWEFLQKFLYETLFITIE